MIWYVKNLLIALDQLANAVLGGWADETLSARCWRTQSLLTYVIDTIFFWQSNHCRESYIWEIERRDLPVEYRD